MTGRISLRDTAINGLHVMQRIVIGDQRGSLERLFCAQELAGILFGRSVRQINRTMTHKRGTVRGMHFQNPPFAEMKIVTCTSGRVFDVALDLRKGSSTFLHWHGEILDSKEHRSLIIPEGCAHGFQTLTDDCEMLYLHTADYTRDAEGGVSPRDARTDIRWPLPISELSERDASHPHLSQEYLGVAL